MNNDMMDLLRESQKALAAVLDDEVCSPARALQLSAIEIKLRTLACHKPDTRG